MNIAHYDRDAVVQERRELSEIEALRQQIIRVEKELHQLQREVAERTLSLEG